MTNKTSNILEDLETLRLLARHRADYAPLVPTMMARIWKLGAPARAAHDLSALRVLFHVAAPCPGWLKEAYIGWLGGERLHELYAGMPTLPGLGNGSGPAFVREDERTG